MATKYATAAGAGSKTGADWANAYDDAALETFLSGSVAAGDIIWVEDGTYSLTADLTYAAAGTTTNPITLIGVQSGTTNEPPQYSDWARDAADRPLFSQGGYKFDLTGYTILRNTDHTGSGTRVIAAGSESIVENCKATNTAAAAGSTHAIWCWVYSQIVNCELTSTNCDGGYGTTGCVWIYNYFHDMTNASYGRGLDPDAYQKYAFNIFDNCRIGANPSWDARHCCINNTFYDCDTGISIGGNSATEYINNLFEGCNEHAFDTQNRRDSNFYWNNWGDDTRNTDMWTTNVDTASSSPYADHPNNQDSLAGDPKFTTAGSDFSLQVDSSCLEAGYGISKGVG